MDMIFVHDNTLLFVTAGGVILFGFIGAWGQFDQAKKIWMTESHASISFVWTITFTMMFASFIVQGLAKQDAVMQLQGWIRVIMYMPILVGMMRFGYQIKRYEVTLSLFLTAVLIIMMAYPSLRDMGFQSLGYLAVAMTCHQPYLLWKTRKRGSFSIKMLTVYNLSVMFWMGYAWVVGNMQNFLLFSSFCGVYSIAMLLWKRAK